ncbi:uncharacterized protein LAJ45_09950 [Morchella importuna]|uniref:uncharacterized protein n=1 Tax=Morchella importuna TaxID=1174673 RepID=UPI001E8D5738|nr:uncharacterized protein LAJ45_09950 [Morchella importuna]KAH8146028.1 hypothetical protein LAJ45_09950 [Morchella importuna]
MASSQNSPSTKPLLPSSAPIPLHPQKQRIDYWAWEYVALLVSFLAVATSAVVLLMFDQKPIPAWSWQSNGISVNSIISLLSTLSRASLLMPIDECMGQLMWLRYEYRAQRLADVGLYNEASRGAWGALRLVWRQRGRTLGCLGSFLLIGSLGIGTAQQQLLSYPRRRFVDLTIMSNLNRALEFNTYQGSTEDPAMSFSLLSSIYSASLFSAANSTSTAAEVLPLFNCPSGGCVFNTFTTLGICSECNDATSQIIQLCDSDNSYCTASFQGLQAFSWSASSSTELNTLLNQSSITNSSVPSNVKSPFARTAHLQAEYGTDGSLPPRYTAAECAIYYCVKEIQANVTNGTYTETVLTALENTNHNPITTSGDMTITGAAANESFLITAPAHASLVGSHGLTAALTGSARSGANSTTQLFTSDILRGFAQDPDIARTMEWVSTALTNRLRNLDRTAQKAMGESYTVQSFIRVRWMWLLYPVTLWTASLVFLICVVVETRGRGMRAWGASQLALVWYGLDAETRGRVRDGGGRR